MKFKNRLGVCSSLAIWSMHAKFQLICAIRLARAMGVVRKLTSHLIFGGDLYIVHCANTYGYLKLGTDVIYTPLPILGTV